MRALALFLGLLTGLYLTHNLLDPFAIVTAILAFLLFFVVFWRKKTLPFYLSAVLVGAALSFFRLPSLDSSFTHFKGIVIESKANYFVFWSNFRRYYVYEKNTLRDVGSILDIYGKNGDYGFTFYESRFNFNEYLSNKGIDQEISVKKIDTIFAFPFSLREKEADFLSHFDKETAALFSSLLFNRKDYESEITSLGSSLGLLSILSSSGLIYGLLLRGFERLLFYKLSEKGSKRGALILGTILLPLSINKIGILRVYLSRSFDLLNKDLLKERFSYLERLSFIGLFLLAIDRYLAFQNGFLLGFGIALFFQFSQNIIQSKKKVYRSLISSLLVYLLIFPITLSNGKFHLFHLFFSWALLPFVFLFYLLGLVSFLTLPFPFLSSMAFYFRHFLKTMAFFDLSFSLPVPSGFAIFLYYLLLVFIGYLLEIGNRSLAMKLSLSSLLLYGVSLFPIVPLCTSEVTFINVGQGDCTLIRDGFDTVMIDTGGNINFDMAEEVLIPYLRKRRIYHIDALIVTHGDYDHMGASSSLKEKFKVKRYIEDASSFPLTIGNIHLTNYNHFEAKEENDSSLVISFELMNKKWLFMGDAPSWVEKKVVEEHPELDCDILKAGHHGSDTSSSLLFLQAVTPEVAILSCGLNNSYGHPHESVINRLKSLGIKIRRTDQEGTISYLTLRGFGL